MDNNPQNNIANDSGNPGSPAPPKKKLSQGQWLLIIGLAAVFFMFLASNNSGSSGGFSGIRATDSIIGTWRHESPHGTVVIWEFRANGDRLITEHGRTRRATWERIDRRVVRLWDNDLIGGDWARDVVITVEGDIMYVNDYDHQHLDPDVLHRQ